MEVDQSWNQNTMTWNKSYPIWAANLALLTDLSAGACSCANPPSPADAFLEATEVFAGIVINITLFQPGLPAVVKLDSMRTVEPPPPQIIDIPMKQVTFQVSETWKGSNTIIKAVSTGLGGGDCGYPFVLGSSYLVYTYGPGSSGDAGAVSACSRTSLYSAAVGDRQFLGAGEQPIHPVLSLVRDQSTTIISWQTNWSNFRLQTAQRLVPPVVWQPVSNYVGILGRNYVVTNEMAHPSSFFRLAQ
jgi:hypothetical protein